MNLSRLVASSLALGALACASPPPGQGEASPQGDGAAALSATGGGAAPAPQTIRTKLYANSYLGKHPPELSIPAAHWRNTETAPRLEDLRGKVVWLEFSFST